MQLEQSLQNGYPCATTSTCTLTVIGGTRASLHRQPVRWTVPCSPTVVSEQQQHPKYAEGRSPSPSTIPAGVPCIDIIARDQGPGIGMCMWAIWDHYSTSGHPWG